MVANIAATTPKIETDQVDEPAEKLRRLPITYSPADMEVEPAVPEVSAIERIRFPDHPAPTNARFVEAVPDAHVHVDEAENRLANDVLLANEKITKL